VEPTALALVGQELEPVADRGGPFSSLSSAVFAGQVPEEDGRSMREELGAIGRVGRLHLDGADVDGPRCSVAPAWSAACVACHLDRSRTRPPRAGGEFEGRGGRVLYLGEQGSAAMLDEVRVALY
jgi:hypothetical protein